MFKVKKIVVKGRELYKIKNVSPCGLKDKCMRDNCSREYIVIEGYEHRCYCSALFRLADKAERFLYAMGTYRI